MPRLESGYKTRLRKKLERLFPGIVILKNDSSYMQGIPDWTLLYRDRWAVLEVKRRWDSDHEVNQDWYVDVLNNLSFAAFIYPENEKEVLNALQQLFTPER